MRHALRISRGRVRVQHFGALRHLTGAGIAIAFILAGAIPVDAAPADPFWLKAVASASRAKEWSPGEMRLAMEMADDKGKVLETWDYRYRLSGDVDGAVRTEVVSAFHNGKDETQKEREAQAKREAQAERDGTARRDGGSDWTTYLDDPFDPAKQDAVEVRLLEGTSEIGGRICVAFAFTMSRPTNVLTEGTAWLDAATGLPVEFVSSPKPMPRAVHELVTTVRYADGLVSGIRVEGSGSLLFFKRRFVSAVTLGGWFLRTSQTDR